MAFSFGNTGASTPAFGTPSTPFGFGAGTPATAAASTPAFSFGNAPAFGASSPSPFGASSTPAFGASSASLFGASSTPAFGFGSAPAFGASSTPGFSFNAAPTQAQTASAFGGGLFGGASTAVTPFGGGPNAQQAQQAATSLLTTDGRPLGHNTKWDDISPAAQNQLLELEKFIVRLREDCAVLDADERLSNPAAAKQRLPETSAALEQDIAALASRIKANESASDAVRDHVIHLLRSTESTLHAFQRSHAWREAAKLPPGQPLPPALVEQLGLGVVLPSPFLAASIESYADQVESLRRALGALQSVLPDEGEAAAAGAAFAGPEGIEGALRNLQDCLLASAARLQALADGVTERKAACLAAARRAGDYGDPFERAAAREREGERAAEARAAAAFSGAHSPGGEAGAGQGALLPASNAGGAQGGPSLFGGAAPGGSPAQGLFGPAGGLFGAGAPTASGNPRKTRVGRR
uniref:Nucleoporin Nup54 alpha-helical domain-containing protein n=1 Tax=Auxenochlorella protothecoides TaxID=3075 RepID=A0A1D1ZP73_AUXPR